MKNLLIKCVILFVALVGFANGQTTKVNADQPRIAIVVEEVFSEDSGFRVFQIKTTETLQTEEVEQYEVKGVKKVNIEGNSKLINALYNKQGLFATKVEVISNNIFLSFHMDILQKYKLSDCRLISIFKKVFEVIENHTERKVVNGGYYTLQKGDLKILLPCAVVNYQSRF